eukprot:TRINITY_DN43104_c0_g1_i1.p1 TRINITY_DN43104_c0_g1~~TRINITY_DN43104_c0_g1_i1.p1  ORF type:complete len:419 (-),score=52.29 TRINITY_DN43104_c0_g1_i1:213-1469(-)
MTSTIDCIGMACANANCNFSPVRFKRRAVGDNDILIDMKYCGVCHSDCAWVKGESGLILGQPSFSDGAMPGHELAGVVAEVGKSVTKFKVGDQIGVGCMVDACLQCEMCKAGEENKCQKKMVWTYGSPNLHGRAGIADGGRQTKGGYSNKFVVHEHFGIKIPSSYPLESAGPIMCAGVTVYSPMKRANVGPGSKVGVVGLGGLGLTAIQIANALGASVTAISRSEAKKKLAVDAGAADYIATAKADQMAEGVGSLDLIINTIPSNHDYSVYCPLLNEGGKMCMLGLTNAFVAAFALEGLACGKCCIQMSNIGGISATQEIIDLADKHKIVPHTKVCPVTELNKIFELCDSGNDAGLRYVLDIAGTLTEETFDKISCGDAPKLAETQGFSVRGILNELVSMTIHQVLCRKRAIKSQKSH